MGTFHGIPLYLPHVGKLQFKRCQLVPGVWIRQYEGGLAARLERGRRNLPSTDRLGPSHLVLIDDDRYLTGVRARIEAEGDSLPKDAHVFVEPGAIARQCVLSLFIAGQLPVRYAEDITFRRSPTLRNSHPSGAGDFDLKFPLPQIEVALASTKISAPSLRRIAHSLDRYYRAGRWWVDRIASALSAMYSALYAAFPDHSFVSLMTSIEALVKTGRGGVTQQVAERVGRLTASTVQTRLLRMEEVRRLYNTRSSLVHGDSRPRTKGVLYDATYATAKRTQVSSEQVTLLLALVQRTFGAVLRNRRYSQILMKHQRDAQTEQQIESYFLAASLRGTLPRGL